MGEGHEPAPGPLAPPLGDADWPAGVAEHLHTLGRLNVYRVMAHHPDLLRSWAPLRAHVVMETTLGRERSEVVILRVAARLGSGYEWAHHVDRGCKAGLNDTRIRAIGGAGEGLDEADALLVAAVDALLDRTRLPPPLASRLAEEVGLRGVFDLMATVGFYATLGFIVETFGTPVDDWLESVPEPGRSTPSVQ